VGQLCDRGISGHGVGSPQGKPAGRDARNGKGPPWAHGRQNKAFKLTRSRSVEALRATTPVGPRSLTRCSTDPDAVEEAPPCGLRWSTAPRRWSLP
jgi:hypothetical protein